MRVSAEERRSLEGVYRWRSSESYCGPVPVITMKQSVEISTCPHYGGALVTRNVAALQAPMAARFGYDEECISTAGACGGAGVMRTVSVLRVPVAMRV